MSDGRLLYGQQFFPDKNLIVQYTERMHDKTSADAQLGAARTEITPNDRDSSVVKVYTDPTALDSLVISGPAKVNLRLPPVLTALTVVFNEQTGSGDYNDTFLGSSSGDHQDLDATLSSSAQASYNIMPDLVPTVVHYDYDVWATRYFFYMTGTVDQAAILTRLQTIIGSPVTALPVFKTRSLTFLCTGQGASIRSEAKVYQSNYLSETFQKDVVTTGKGHSTDGSITIREVQIPPTLHAQLTISPAPYKYGSVTVTAKATINGGLNFPPQSVVNTKSTPLQRAEVFPTGATATSPTSIPTSGLYLTDSEFSPDKEWNRTRVFAEVVDFSQYA